MSNTGISSENEIFARQCTEAGEKIITTLFSYPKPVVVCLLPGVLAAVMMTLELPRETIISMLDSALENMRE